jgi:hypothetical protein
MGATLGALAYIENYIFAIFLFLGGIRRGVSTD